MGALLQAPQRYWYNPVCPGAPYDAATWDLDGCFQATVLAALAPAVLALVGGVEFPALWRRFKAGERERLPKEGKAAYGLKLVSSLSHREEWRR